MKKKILIGLLLLLTSQVLFSQNNGYVVSRNNGFIVKQYSPALTDRDAGPLEQEPSSHLGWWSLPIDLEDDGEPDMEFTKYEHNRYETYLCIGRMPNGSVDVCNHSYRNIFIFLHYGKSTSEIDSLRWTKGYCIYSDYQIPFGTVPPIEEFVYFPVRKKVGDDYYYGWVFTYIFLDYVSTEYQIISSAMCTVPNRHIFLGQIDLNEDMPTLGEETTEDVWSFCQGSYTFLRCGDSMQFSSVEVYDTRGIRVKVVEDITTPGKNWVDIGLENYPAGLYLVRYRLADGSEGCVKIIHTR